MNKIILITGSTDGIGKLAAQLLAKDGHQLYLHGRNSKKLMQVVNETKRLSNNEKIKGFTSDFSDLNAVRQMAQDIEAETSKIDVLIKNAGVFKSPNIFTPDGFDLRFAVNYFAPYLLTHALIPLLEQGTDARIINLSSAAQSSISHEVLLGKQEQSIRETYAQSKLAITMWSFYLAQQLNKISVIALNPGSLLNTKMVQEAFGTHWDTADKGANIIYELAVSEKYKGVTGKYFDNDKGGFGPAHADAYDTVLIDQLLQVTSDLLKS